MQTQRPDLGKLTSVHRPSMVRLWLLAAIALGLLIPILLGIALTVESLTSFTSNTKESFARGSSPLICVGAASLFLLLIGNFWIRDYRKWSATKTTRLTIYEKGLIYESEGRTDSCRWEEIKDITHRSVGGP